ncbi:inner membrane protein [Lentilactobacillus kosonis]|uniref:Inner membrane protein n=1 Tax=Lentilactobacillus kosonis TaxID=2810561 RepID=A0A401FMU2_9LACO|nr:inner membrane protein [Lentilactobacillus kosonis]
MKNYSVTEIKSFGLAAILTLICALIGTFLAGLPYLNLVGALVISLLMGMVFQVFKGPVKQAKFGIGFISNKFLRLGIILLGFKLNLLDLARAGG